MFNIFKRKNKKTNETFAMIGLDDTVKDVQVDTYIEQIVKLYDLIKDVDDKMAHQTIKGMRNTIYWMVGHVIVHNELLLVPEEKRQPEIKNIEHYFKSGTSPEDFDEAIPAFDSLKELIKEKERKLINAACKENPVKQIEFAINHMTLHYGQLKTMLQILS